MRNADCGLRNEFALFLHRSTFIDIISPKNFTDALTAPPDSAFLIAYFWDRVH